MQRMGKSDIEVGVVQGGRRKKRSFQVTERTVSRAAAG